MFKLVIRQFGQLYRQKEAAWRKQKLLALYSIALLAISSPAFALVTACPGHFPKNVNGDTMIPVCYTQRQASRIGFASWLPMTRQVVQSTWGRAANITFTGWAQCSGTIAAGTIALDGNATDEPGEGDECWSMDQPTYVHMDPQRLNSGFWPNIAVHEFGHALGFHHEADRSDNPFWSLPSYPDISSMAANDPRNYCWLTSYDWNSSTKHVTTPITSAVYHFVTAYDRWSIMNYCGESFDLALAFYTGADYWIYQLPADRATLSPLDVTGVQTVYGKKPAQSIIAANGMALTAVYSPILGINYWTLREPTNLASRISAAQRFDTSQQKIQYSNYSLSTINGLRTTSLSGGSTLLKLGMRWMGDGDNCVVAQGAQWGSTLTGYLPCGTMTNALWDFDVPFSGAIRLSGTNLCVSTNLARNSQLQLDYCPAQPTPQFIFVEGRSMFMSQNGYCVNQNQSQSSFGGVVVLTQCYEVTGLLANHLRGPITDATTNLCLSSNLDASGNLAGPVSCNGSLDQEWDIWLRDDQNLSLGQYAYQSSTYFGGDASRAVDGNTDGNFWDSSVSLTNYDTNAWWAVYLGGQHTVTSLKIFNRTDWGMEQLSHFGVYAWSDVGSYWYQIADYSNTDTTNSPAIWVTLSSPVNTQYIQIMKANTSYLQLAEVQIFGR